MSSLQRGLVMPSSESASGADVRVETREDVAAGGIVVALMGELAALGLGKGAPDFPGGLSGTVKAELPALEAPLPPTAISGEHLRRGNGSGGAGAVASAPEAVVGRSSVSLVAKTSTASRGAAALSEAPAAGGEESAQLRASSESAACWSGTAVTE